MTENMCNLLSESGESGQGESNESFEVMGVAEPSLTLKDERITATGDAKEGKTTEHVTIKVYETKFVR